MEGRFRVGNVLIKVSGFPDTKMGPKWTWSKKQPGNPFHHFDRGSVFLRFFQQVMQFEETTFISFSLFTYVCALISRKFDPNAAINRGISRPTNLRVGISQVASCFGDLIRGQK